MFGLTKLGTARLAELQGPGLGVGRICGGRSRYPRTGKVVGAVWLEDWGCNSVLRR